MEGRSARLVSALPLAVLLALSGCAGAGSRGPASATASPEPSVSIRIGPDGPELPEDAIAGLQAYGAEHADEFGGLYVDDQAQGSFVMLFTDHLEEHTAAVAEIWPRVSVRAVRYTEAELIETLESAMQSMSDLDGVDPVGGGVDTINNVVTIDVKTDDPTFELRTELQYGGRVDVIVHPVPGPWQNAEAGDGWRLLAAGQSGFEEAYTVRAATDETEWTELWNAIGLEGEAPSVDFADEVVVSFAHGIGSSCRELRLDGVTVGDVVFSQTSDPLAPRACTGDLAGAAVFVVAIERAALPSDGFVLQLSKDSVTCVDCGSSEQIEVDLP